MPLLRQQSVLEGGLCWPVQSPDPSTILCRMLAGVAGCTAAPTPPSRATAPGSGTQPALCSSLAVTSTFWDALSCWMTCSCQGPATGALQSCYTQEPVSAKRAEGTSQQILTGQVSRRSALQRWAFKGCWQASTDAAIALQGSRHNAT